MTSHARSTQADHASFAYSLFKVLSILMVLTGHWFSSSSIPLWIPTDLGLFIFAFSSGMFTSRIYGAELDIRAFWRKKLQRLLLRYWLILSFLSLLLLAYGKPVFHWHSLVHFFGLSGFLNLFGHNQSALGNGLWFFSLLLLFYVSYPYIARLFVATGRNLLAPLAFTAILVYLDHRIYVGFALWLSTLGFILGVYAGRYDSRMVPALSLSMAASAMGAMLFLNAWLDYKGANGILLALACIFSNLWLMNVRIPQLAPLRWLASLEDCLLEIYLIHTYLFMHPSGRNVVDFALSTAAIIAVAWLLNLAASTLMQRLFRSRKTDAAIPTTTVLFIDRAAIDMRFKENSGR